MRVVPVVTQGIPAALETQVTPAPTVLLVPQVMVVLLATPAGKVTQVIPELTAMVVLADLVVMLVTPVVLVMQALVAEAAVAVLVGAALSAWVMPVQRVMRALFRAGGPTVTVVMAAAAAALLAATPVTLEAQVLPVTQVPQVQALLLVVQALRVMLVPMVT